VPPPARDGFPGNRKPTGILTGSRRSFCSSIRRRRAILVRRKIVADTNSAATAVASIDRNWRLLFREARALALAPGEACST
jgi:hypothetical protein